MTLIVCLGVLTLGAVLWRPWTLVAQGVPPANVKLAAISQADMTEWLTYLASDALQGRQVYTEGYGLAAGYVSAQLKSWGVKPIGDAGYFQTVKLRAYRSTRNSSVTVEVNGQSRTFKHGDHVTFAANAGARQALTFTGAEFVGYGIFTSGRAADEQPALRRLQRPRCPRQARRLSAGDTVAPRTRSESSPARWRPRPRRWRWRQPDRTTRFRTSPPAPF